MIVYIIIGEIGKDADLRTFIHRVYLSKKRAEHATARLNDTSNARRRELAIAEQERVERLTGKPHPLSLDALIEQMSNEPYYEVQDHVCVIEEVDDDETS